MKISKRATRMPYSPIRKLTPYAVAAKERGLKVYHLNIGQPDILTPQCALDAVRSVDRKVLEYSPSQGIKELREAMSGYYARFGLDVSPEEIIVTTGGSEAILFALMSCLDEGDELLVTDPSYANYNAFATACGAVLKSIPTSIDSDFALPDVEDFDKAVTPRTKAILICNPNNPTGYVYSREEMSTLKDIAIRHGLYLICDEVYREFVYDGVEFCSALSLEGPDDNVILVDSVSKRYSECGIRIGALVTRNKAVREAVMKFCQARLSPPLLGQIAAVASYGAGEDYMKGVYDEYIGRRNFLIGSLNRIPGVFTPMPKGAFYTMVRLPVEDTEDFCRWCLTDFSWKGATVMMAPGAGFYSVPDAPRNEVRMAYVLNKEDLAEALEVLEKALEAYRKIK
jgi:aspartate aminotransferase